MQTYNQKIHIHDDNETGDDYIVSDIHGCYTLLMQKLKEVDFDFNNDRLFCVGDLIDRGPENEQCLELIYQPWFFPVIGNHELLFYAALYNHPSSDSDSADWLNNGGGWVFNTDLTLDDLHLYSKEIDTLMPLAIEIRKKDRTIGIVHAEPLKDWQDVVDFCGYNYSLSQMLLKKSSDFTRKQHHDFNVLTWGRNRIYGEDKTIVSNIDQIYVGHTILKQPVDLGNVRYIDTGAFSTGVLTLEKL